MEAACPAADGSSPHVTTFDAPPPMCVTTAKRYSAEMATSLGKLVISLNVHTAPKTVNNFVFLARYHFYDGLIFHRIIRGFMCQGGDPTATGTGGPGYQFVDELPKPGRYDIGSLAMANAGPNTNGSQFFIVSGPKGRQLPPQYSLFGQVAKGLDALDAMQNVPTVGERPQTDVTIHTVTITEVDEPPTGHR